MAGNGCARLANVRVLLGLCVGLLCSGCGESAVLPDPGPRSGIDPEKSVVGLSASELVTLCDWTAGRLEGYGQSISCSDGTRLSAASSRDACVASYARVTASCGVTIDDVEACVNGVVATTPCTAIPVVCFELLSCAGP
jgi:hypothetical protein